MVVVVTAVVMTTVRDSTATMLQINLFQTVNADVPVPSTMAQADPPQTTASAPASDAHNGRLDGAYSASRELLWPLAGSVVVFAVGWLTGIWWRRRAHNYSPGVAHNSATHEARQYQATPPRKQLTESTAQQHPPASTAPEPSGDKPVDEALITRLARRDSRIGMLKKRIKRLKKELRTTRGHRKKVRADSPQNKLKSLRKQARIKNEIIASLEEIVAENREKWLHRDAVEAALDEKIAKLSTDLELAMNLLDERKRDTG